MRSDVLFVQKDIIHQMSADLSNANIPECSVLYKLHGEEKEQTVTGVSG